MYPGLSKSTEKSTFFEFSLLILISFSPSTFKGRGFIPFILQDFTSTAKKVVVFLQSARKPALSASLKEAGFVLQSNVVSIKTTSFELYLLIRKELSRIDVLS